MRLATLALSAFHIGFLMFGPMPCQLCLKQCGNFWVDAVLPLPARHRRLKRKALLLGLDDLLG
jgi:hypothetical protein